MAIPGLRPAASDPLSCLPDGRWSMRRPQHGGTRAAEWRVGPTWSRRPGSAPPASCLRRHTSTAILRCRTDLLLKHRNRIANHEPIFGSDWERVGAKLANRHCDALEASGLDERRLRCPGHEQGHVLSRDEDLSCLVAPANTLLPCHAAPAPGSNLPSDPVIQGKRPTAARKNADYKRQQSERVFKAAIPGPEPEMRRDIDGGNQQEAGE